MTAHAIMRARERYGIELSAGDICAMQRAIRARRSFILARRTEADGVKELHIVSHAAHTLPVVYSPLTEGILTVLPPDSKELVRWPPETWEVRSDAMRACVIEGGGFLRRGDWRPAR